MPNDHEPLATWSIDVDDQSPGLDDLMGESIDRMFSEMQCYYSFAEIVTLVSEALGRFADREQDSADER